MHPDGFSVLVFFITGVFVGGVVVLAIAFFGALLAFAFPAAFFGALFGTLFGALFGLAFALYPFFSFSA